MGEWMYRSTLFLTSELVGGESSASRPGRFTLGERTSCIICTGGSVGLRTGLDDAEKRKFLTLPRFIVYVTALLITVTTASNYWTILNDESERMRKEAAVGQSQALFRHFPGGATRNPSENNRYTSRGTNRIRHTDTYI
jgi:hypothetical protein